jgi:hypothetical protein
MAAIIASLLLLGALLFTLLPLFLVEEVDSAEGEAREHDELTLQKERLVAQLRDLSLDEDMRKISVDEHGVLRLEVEARLAVILRRLDERAAATADRVVSEAVDSTGPAEEGQPLGADEPA